MLSGLPPLQGLIWFAHQRQWVGDWDAHQTPEPALMSRLLYLSPLLMPPRPFLPGTLRAAPRVWHSVPATPALTWRRYRSGSPGAASTPSSLEPMAGGLRGRDEESTDSSGCLRSQATAAASSSRPGSSQELAVPSGALWVRPQSRFATGDPSPPRSAPPRRSELAHWPRGTARRSPAAAHLGCSKGQPRLPANHALNLGKKRR